MDALMLIVSVALPWVAGAAWLRFLPKSPPLPWATAIGYGHFIGVLAVTSVLRLYSAAGIKWNFAAVACALLVFAAIPVWRARARWREALAKPDLAEDWALLGRRTRIVLVAIGVVLVARFAGLLLEIVWRPLFPWDAWMQWATKARVWFDLGYMAPFAPYDAWATGDPARIFTDPAPGYPATVPLLQVWSCIALGRWDDALMNVPWFACGVALGFAFWAQVRAWGAPPTLAAAATYLLLTVPFVDTHIALAGYAELHLAATYGLAAMAFFLWARDGDARQGWLALVLAAALPFIKRPGIFWLASFIPAYLVMLKSRLTLVAMGVAATAGLIVAFVLRSTGIRIFNYALTADVNAGEVTSALAQNLFEMGNWNLFFWYLPLMALVAWRGLLRGPLAPITTMIAFGTYFLGIVFYFSIAGDWVSDFSTVNRAVFHMVPLAAFWLVALVLARFYSPPEPPRLV